MFKKSENEFPDVYPMMYNLSKDFKDERRPEKSINMVVKDVTLVVTEDCCLRCSYCYQHNKNNNHRMTKETARKIIDALFEYDKENNIYINSSNSKAIVLEFIGGEPLLEIDLIDYTVHYFRWKALQLNHRWALHHMISITSNGVHFTDKKVQNFIFKNIGRLSFTITIDGNKELHDSCRVFPDGSPSYDIVANSVKLAKSYKVDLMTNTKLTLAPANVSHTFEAVKNLYEEFHFDGVFANCVYEKGWTLDDARVLYYELKKLADWMVDDNIQENFYCTLFDEEIGKPVDEDDNQNWCGGTGEMLCFTSDGHIEPCLRYTHFNLNDKQPEMIIGTLEDGLAKTQEHLDTIKMLDGITRRSQSTDECFNCPIGFGCSWCSAYNYEVNGTPDKRVTYICPMHKARVLANVYYWNKTYKKYNLDKAVEMNCPKEWAVEFLPEEEYNMLCEIVNK